MRLRIFPGADLRGNQHRLFEFQGDSGSGRVPTCSGYGHERESWGIRYSARDPSELACRGGSASWNSNVDLPATGFVESSQVHWQGLERPTTFTDSEQLRAVISASDIAVPGSAEIKVFNPAPGGGLSDSLFLAINPIPYSSDAGTVIDNRR